MVSSHSESHGMKVRWSLDEVGLLTTAQTRVNMKSKPRGDGQGPSGCRWTRTGHGHSLDRTQARRRCNNQPTADGHGQGIERT